MQRPNLVKAVYQDTQQGIFLECYADMIVYQTTKGCNQTLFAIRLGGYPEQVQAMSDAIYGGGDIRLEQDERIKLQMSTLSKRYDRSLSMDGVYAEATLFPQDDLEIAAAKDEDQTKLPTRRNCYLFTPVGDRDQLLEEIDRRTSVPLIPEFRDYFLDALIQKEILTPLKVFSPNHRFDAWQLACSPEDQNLIEVLEEGLKTGTITIPGATPENSVAFEKVRTVSQYLSRFGVTIAQRIKGQFRPLFDPETGPLSSAVLEVNETIRQNCGYSLYPAQLAAAEALKRKVDRHEPAIIVAECGAGKSKIGAAALCPSHVAKKWVREIKETIPHSTAAVIGSMAELRRFYEAYQQEEKTAFAVISKEKARDGYARYPSVLWNRIKSRFVCPECGKPILMDVSKDGVVYSVPAEACDFLRENRDNHKCRSCGPLGAFVLLHHANRLGKYWRLRFCPPAIRSAISLSGKVPSDQRTDRSDLRFPRRLLSGSWGCPAVSPQQLHDELHQYNNDSGQGDAMGEIVRTADKTIGMTATLINGYASGIFHLLYRLLPRQMELDGQNYHASERFSKEYGVVEAVYNISYEDSNTNRRSYKKKIRERQLPGVSPLVYSRFLLENAVFLSLADMGKELPEYEEIPVELEMRDDIRTEYLRLEREFRRVIHVEQKVCRRVMSALMGLLTVYPDQPYDQPPILDPRNKKIAMVTPASLSSIEELHQKDLKLLELVQRKMDQGENVLVYTSWVRIDTQQKLLSLFAQHGFPAAVLSAAVSPQKREEWMEKKLRAGVRILITNPTLVETGLDLNAFTTIVYYNIAYNLFTLRQSSRRSWRINQTAPRIEVYFFFYKETMQARAMGLMASKLAAAGVLEGNVTDEGLAAMSDCRDLTSQLARELTLGIQSKVEDLAAVFKRMAVLRPLEEKTANQGRSASVLQLPDPISRKEPPRPSHPPKDPVFLFATSFRRRDKKAKPQLCEEQLSFFDQPA